MMRKIRNKNAKNEPIVQKIADIYSKDIYLNPKNEPTSKRETTTNEFINNVNAMEKEDMEMNGFKPWDNQMMWNSFLVRDFYSAIKRKKWVMPVVHGYID